MKRNGRGPALAVRGVGAFRVICSSVALRARTSVIWLASSSRVALAVGQHRLKIGRRGRALNGSPLEKATSSRRNHRVCRRRSDASGLPAGLYAAVSLILHQRFIDHALGKHLVGRIEMGIQRADVNRPRW